jgi:hypothetical protein
MILTLILKSEKMVFKFIALAFTIMFMIDTCYTKSGNSLSKDSESITNFQQVDQQQE